MAIERKQHLRAAKATEGTAWWVVGVVQRGLRAHIGIGVHVVAAHGTDVHHIPRQPGVGSAFGHEAHLLGHNLAVFAHTQLEGDVLGHTGAGRLKIFQAVINQTHWAAGVQRQQASQQLVVVFDNLAAKAPARGGLNHSHPRDRQPQSLGHLHTHQVDRLGRGLQH